jgi:hypothetical protein
MIVKHISKFALLAAAFAFIGIGTAQSQIIFDFGPGSTFAGSESVTDLSSTFNSTLHSGVSLSASIGNTIANSRDRSGFTSPDALLASDFIQWAGGPTVNITISGLAASTEYEITLWSGDGAAGQVKTTDHTIAGSSGGGTFRHTSVDAATHNSTLGNQFDLPNVTSTAGGQLTYTIDYIGGGGSATTLNGLQLTVVPEPSSATLLLLGLGSLFALRRMAK